jgi:hypothetical protein
MGDGQQRTRPPRNAAKPGPFLLFLLAAPPSSPLPDKCTHLPSLPRSLGPHSDPQTPLRKPPNNSFTSEGREAMPSSKDAPVIAISTFTMISHGGKRSEVGEAMMAAIREREWGLLLLDEVHVVPAAMFRKVGGWAGGFYSLPPVSARTSDRHAGKDTGAALRAAQGSWILFLFLFGPYLGGGMGGGGGLLLLDEVHVVPAAMFRKVGGQREGGFFPRSKPLASPRCWKSDPCGPGRTAGAALRAARAFVGLSFLLVARVGGDKGGNGVLGRGRGAGGGGRSGVRV